MLRSKKSGALTKTKTGRSFDKGARYGVLGQFDVRLGQKAMGNCLWEKNKIKIKIKNNDDCAAVRCLNAMTNGC